MVFDNMQIWKVLNLILAGKSNQDICKKLKINPRKLQESVFILKRCGIKVKYQRSNDSYSATFPQRDLILNLNSFEFFTLLSAIMLIKDKSGKIEGSRKKLKKIAGGDYSSFMDEEAENTVYLQVSELLKSIIDEKVDVFQKIHKGGIK